jgi:hypothetical protein
MSDGDNATPGLPSAGPSHARGDNQWLTRSPQPSPGAAPWERSGNSDSGEIEKAGQTGNHTDGVTVADLIAKLHGVASVPEELRRTRPEPEPEPESQAPPTEVIAAVYVDSDEPDTEVIPSPCRLRPTGPRSRRRATGYRPPASGPAVATGAEPRGAAKCSGRAAATLIAVCAGADRWGLAMAIVEEQHAQQGLRARPEFTRHP